MSKLPQVVYYATKLKTTSKAQLLTEWENAPLSEREKKFLLAIQAQSSLQELAEAFSMTVSGVTKWKQRLFSRLHRYDLQNFRR